MGSGPDCKTHGGEGGGGKDSELVSLHRKCVSTGESLTIPKNSQT